MQCCTPCISCMCYDRSVFLCPLLYVCHQASARIDSLGLLFLYFNVTLLESVASSLSCFDSLFFSDCMDRKFGADCSSECGQCESMADCNVFNGSCAACQNHFKLPLCKSMLFRFFCLMFVFLCPRIVVSVW